MPLVVAFPALEGLPSVSDEEFKGLVRFLVSPPLLSAHMLLAEFDEGLALAI